MLPLLVILIGGGCLIVGMHLLLSGLTPWLMIPLAWLGGGLMGFGLASSRRRAREAEGFATESWVGLPVDVATRLAQNERHLPLHFRGIGLLSVSPEGCCEVVPAQHRTGSMMDPLVVDAAERLYRAWRARPGGGVRGSGSPYHDEQT